MLAVKESNTNKRPAILNKRVFFLDDFPGKATIYQNDLLYLHLKKEHGKRKYKWQFVFDLIESGKNPRGVTFTKEEYKTLIDLLESKPFDWRNRTLGNSSKYFSQCLNFTAIETGFLTPE
ncbi:MAG TPA: hypothetical protein V6D28_24060 [Leptolyngbyaceae cyanobacterium]